MILIFTTKFDYSSTCVINWLNYLGLKVVRINGDDDVFKFSSINGTGIYFRNTITNELVNLKRASSCWWRRTGISNRHFISLDEDLGDFDLPFLKNQKEYMTNEFRALKEYIFEAIYKNCPINLGKPIFNLNRLIVLDVAKENGFKTPNYEVITNGKQLVDSKKSLNKIVTKAISNGIYDDIDNQRFYTYTESMDDEFYLNNKHNIFFPSLITSLVEKKIEIRVFFLDDHFFSMAILSQSDEKTKIDFRKYSDNRNEPYKLPDEIEDKLKLIFNELSLNCGSVDLILDENDEYVFLEINPVGQYSMTSEPCNYNLDQKIAKYLIDGRVIIN